MPTEHRPYNCYYIDDAVRPAGNTRGASWYYTGTFVDGAHNTILQFFVRFHKTGSMEGSDRQIIVNLGNNPTFPREIGSHPGFTILGFVEPSHSHTNGIMVAQT